MFSVSDAAQDLSPIGVDENNDEDVSSHLASAPLDVDTTDAGGLAVALDVAHRAVDHQPGPAVLRRGGAEVVPQAHDLPGLAGRQPLQPFQGQPLPRGVPAI